MHGSFKDRNYTNSGLSGGEYSDFGVRVAVVLRRGDAVLLVRHEKHGREPYYVLPGGRLEPNETIPQCAVREMNEETGLDVQFTEVLYINEFFREDRHTVDVTVAVTQVDDEEASLGSDPEVVPGQTPTLSALMWMSFEELPSVGLLPPQVAQRMILDADGGSSGGAGGVYLGAGRD